MEKVKLGEVFNITSGGTPSRKNDEYYINGNIKWVKTGDLKKKYIETTDECITEKGLENSSAKLYHKDTVLIAMYGATIGAVSILTTDACTNQACAAFSKNEKVIPEYLYYFLKSKKSQFVNDAFGGAQPNISAGYLKSVSFNLLELDEQKNIVNKMNISEEIINTRKKQIDELDELIKSQFVEMFGDININNKKWKEDVLKNNLSVIGGYAFKSSEFQENGIPILKIGNINTGKFRTKDLMFWKEDRALENYLIYPNDVLMSLTGTVGKEDYGNICIIGNEYPKYYLNQRNAKLNIRESLNKEYIAYALRVPEIKRRLTGISRGVRQANISNKDIENLKLPIPPIELQNQFADIVKQINLQKFQILKSLEQIQKLQESLMNQYF